MKLQTKKWAYCRAKSVATLHQPAPPLPPAAPQLLLKKKTGSAVRSSFGHIATSYPQAGVKCDKPNVISHEGQERTDGPSEFYWSLRLSQFQLHSKAFRFALVIN